MKTYEVPKGETEIKRGRVMMAVEGPEERVAKVAAHLKTAGYRLLEPAQTYSCSI